MHPKYKTYWENQIISYSGKHYQFLSTLHLAVPCSYDLSFRAPLSAGAQYLSLDLCLQMAPQSKPVGATRTWELAQHFAELELLKSSQVSTVTEWSMGHHPYRAPLHWQQWYMKFYQSLKSLWVWFFGFCGSWILDLCHILSLYHRNCLELHNSQRKREIFCGKTVI